MAEYNNKNFLNNIINCSRKKIDYCNILTLSLLMIILIIMAETGIYTSRLVCAKINIFMRDLGIKYVSYVDNKFVVEDIVRTLQHLRDTTADINLIQTIDKYIGTSCIITITNLITYVWDNIITNFTIDRHITQPVLFLSFVTAPLYYTIKNWKYCTYRTSQHFGFFLIGCDGNNESYVKNSLNKYFVAFDKVILFKIGVLVTLVDRNLILQEIMHIVLDKLFF